jgi:hypothetical protein
MSYRNITMLISACSVPVYIIIVVAFLFVQCQGASGDDKSINSIASRRSLPDLFLDAIGRNVELGMNSRGTSGRGKQCLLA